MRVSREDTHSMGVLSGSCHFVPMRTESGEQAMCGSSRKLQVAHRVSDLPN